MTYYALTGLINGITSTILGTFVFFKNRHRAVNRSFGIYYTLSISIWSYSYFLWQIASDTPTALFWSRMLTIGAIFIPVTVLHFIIHWLGVYQNKRKWIYIGYCISFIFISLSFSNLLVVGVEQKLSFKFWPNAGKLYPFYLLFFFVYAIYACYLMYHHFHRSTGAKRNQIKYILFGTILGYIGGSTNFPLWYNIHLPPVGNITTAVFVAIVTYAIARYRLMDINIAIRKVIASLVLMMLLGCIVISLYISPLGLVFKAIGAFVLAILVAVYLPDLKYLLERFINRVLYGTKYDYQKTLVEISNTVPTIIDLDKLLKYIADKVCESMGIAKGAVLLKEDVGNKYTIHYQRGFDGEKGSSIILETQGPLVSRIKDIEDVLVKHEMVQMLNEESFKELCADLDRLDAEVVVPIRKGDNLTGMLTLSNKAGGDTFGQEDFRLLHIIAIQAAVAIENIRLYNKLIHVDRQTFLETLASGVSHEMRNRLVAIRTFIDLFPERVNSEYVEKGFLEFRELAVREMERLTKIVDGLLSYSRAVTTGGEKLSINNLIEEVLFIIEPKLREKEIKLNKNLDQNVSTIKGDKGRLLQVFINIMHNGIEAMNKRGELSVVSIENDNEIEVDISDNGKGIAKEHLDAIFEPFFTTKHTGTGLGLSIVQRIVRDHNGKVRVESEVGKGTTFIITFFKGAEYKPTEIKAKEDLNYWEVKKGYERSKPEKKD